MLPRVCRKSRKVLTKTHRFFYTSHQCNVKVAILGAAGDIGQPLALLLKHSPMISHLALYDLAPFTTGVAADVSHIETQTFVTGHTDEKGLKDCLEDSSVVLITAGMTRKPGITEEELFDTNASIAMKLADACASYCPGASIGVVTNPLNSTVPIVSEVFKRRNLYDIDRIFGITTLDVIRANTFVSEMKQTDISITNVPVIGGHSGATILPLLSQVVPKVSFTEEEIISLTDRIQNAETEIVEAKAGAGSSTLSMAFATTRFTFSLLEAMHGQGKIVECLFTGTFERMPNFERYGTYFAAPVILGYEGVTTNLGVNDLSDFESNKLEQLLPQLKEHIERGEDFVERNLTS